MQTSGLSQSVLHATNKSTELDEAVAHAPQISQAELDHLACLPTDLLKDPVRYRKALIDHYSSSPATHELVRDVLTENGLGERPVAVLAAHCPPPSGSTPHENDPSTLIMLACEAYLRDMGYVVATGNVVPRSEVYHRNENNASRVASGLNNRAAFNLQLQALSAINDGLVSHGRPGIAFAVLSGPEAQAAPGIDFEPFALQTTSSIHFSMISVRHFATIVLHHPLELVSLAAALTFALRRCSGHTVSVAGVLLSFWDEWHIHGQSTYCLPRPLELMRRSLEIMNVMLAPDESEDVTVRQFDRLFTSLDRARQLDERISDLPIERVNRRQLKYPGRSHDGALALFDRRPDRSTGSAGSDQHEDELPAIPIHEVSQPTSSITSPAGCDAFQPPRTPENSQHPHDSLVHRPGKRRKLFAWSDTGDDEPEGPKLTLRTARHNELQFALEDSPPPLPKMTLPPPSIISLADTASVRSVSAPPEPSAPLRSATALMDIATNMIDRLRPVRTYDRSASEPVVLPPLQQRMALADIILRAEARAKVDERRRVREIEEQRARDKMLAQKTSAVSPVTRPNQMSVPQRIWHQLSSEERKIARFIEQATVAGHGAVIGGVYDVGQKRKAVAVALLAAMSVGQSRFLVACPNHAAVQAWRQSIEAVSSVHVDEVLESERHSAAARLDKNEAYVCVMTHQVAALGDFLYDMRRVFVDVLIVEGGFYSHPPFLNKLATMAKWIKNKTRICVTSELRPTAATRKTAVKKWLDQNDPPLFKYSAKEAADLDGYWLDLDA